ncbi:MAG: aldolase/citrate lyase family protein [Verrucomicrobiales bacterium]|nr:aldolase/citrate lyase family protein [Verrucomicrobiales bacterium]
MRKSKTLKKIRDGRAARMCVLGHFIPSYIHHAAGAGFDVIWLDMEHRTFSDNEIAALLTHFHLADIDCMLRPPTVEKTKLYRYLEDGAAGLMIPHVSTAEKARELVAAVKFPPLGERGLDGAGLDANYYLEDAESYPAEANRETFLVVQIETIEAVKNVDEIAAVPGVDGMFVGPGDLGLRLKELDNEGLDLEAVYEKVAAAAKREGIAWGCPAGSPELVEKLRAQGAQLLAYGGDFMTLKNMLDNNGKELTRIYGED